MRRALISMSIALLIAGCGSAGEGGEADEAAVGKGAPAGEIQLEPDGITYIYPDGRTGRAGFGSGLSLSRQLAAAALGAPRASGESETCQSGPMEIVRFAGGLTLNYRGTRFVGWDLVGDGDTRLKTTRGVGIGTTRAELEAAIPVTAAPAVRGGGEAFVSGDLAGILNGPGSADTVTQLWAGTTCHPAREPHA